MTAATLSPAMRMVEDFRAMTTGDGNYADVPAIAASVNADPATVGVLACVSTHRETPPILVPNQAIALEMLAAVDPDATAYTVHRTIGSIPAASRRRLSTRPAPSDATAPMRTVI
jgi:hypothetical protein